MGDNTAQDQICKIETARWDIAKVRSNEGHCARGRIRSIFVSLYYSWRIRRSSWIIFMIGMRRDFLMNFLNWRFQFHSTFYVRIPLRLHQSNNSANWRKSRLGFPRKHDVHHQHFFFVTTRRFQTNSPCVADILCNLCIHNILSKNISEMNDVTKCLPCIDVMSVSPLAWGSALLTKFYSYFFQGRVFTGKNLLRMSTGISYLSNVCKTNIYICLIFFSGPPQLIKADGILIQSS